jgi:integrase
MTTLSTKSSRARLAQRREPYWTQLGRGAYLGFRAGAGTWIARYRDLDGKQHYQSLGEHEEFTVAKEQAERWLSQVTKGAHRAPSRGTVRDALSGYVRHLRSIGRRGTAWDVGQRFRLTVGRMSEFGRVRLEDARREDFETWRNDLRKGRQPRSVNRQVRAVVAGLNYAVKDGGHVGNREAWKLTHLVDDGEESTPVFLTDQQRDRLIAAASPAVAALLTGFSHTGARPSELAKATAADFDAKGGTVTLSHRKGRGAKFRSRATQLDNEGLKFFKAQSRGKLPKAPLIANESGGHFTDQEWCRGIELAIIAANKTAKKPAQRIPAGASAYSFRHTRISELLQVYGVDPLTTAQQTGTSVTMIEKYYFKFISSSMRDKLNAVKGKGGK